MQNIQKEYKGIFNVTKNTIEIRNEWKTVGSKKSIPMTMALATAKSFTSTHTGSGDVENNDKTLEGDEEDNEEVDLTNEQVITKKVKIEMIENGKSKEILQSPSPKVPTVIALQGDGEKCNESQTSNLTNEGNASTQTSSTNKSGTNSVGRSMNKHKWTRLQNKELIFCYYYAVAKGLSKTNGVYEEWRSRNPKLVPSLNAAT